MNANGTYKNPAFGLYRAMVPAPNQNFLSPTQQPVNNFFRAAEPDQPHNIQSSVRMDINQSSNSRFFIRANGNKFEESSLSDWTYASPDPQYAGLHDVSRNRYSWSLTGTWTRVLKGSTVIDTQISGNRAFQRDTRKNLVNYEPTSVVVGLDDFCLARTSASASAVLADQVYRAWRHGRRRHPGHDLPGASRRDVARAAHTRPRRVDVQGITRDGPAT